MGLRRIIQRREVQKRNEERIKNPAWKAEKKEALDRLRRIRTNLTLVSNELKPSAGKEPIYADVLGIVGNVALLIKEKDAKKNKKDIAILPEKWVLSPVEQKECITVVAQLLALKKKWDAKQQALKADYDWLGAVLMHATGEQRKELGGLSQRVFVPRWSEK